VVGGLSFYQRAEVKDALSYLKAVVSPQDTVSLLRIINTPARGIGKTSIEQIEQYANERQITVWSAIGQMLEEKIFPARAEAALLAFRKLIQELSSFAESQPVHETLKEILDRTGYRRTLEADNDPESEGRLANLAELVNAAVEASERGEGISEFLDHAALVADSDSLDIRAQVSLLTLHNAKGLEFPIVFLAGLEEGLFPHSRSLDSKAAMEEERRLCYVGMTRAEQRLFLTNARYRRRYGGGQPEASIPSRFLKEVPQALVQDLNPKKTYPDARQVSQTPKPNPYTGKTYNSVENIQQYFTERGKAAPQLPTRSEPVTKAVPTAHRPPPTPIGKRGLRTGATVRHPKYGLGTILRREGEGDDAKLTVSFQGYGLKKLVEKFAGITEE
jgi:DNA helicase-2/ATP-dependent DNA helicase PcrA